MIGIHEGRFDFRLYGMVLNEAGQTLFETGFFFSSEPDLAVQGIFQHDDSTGMRNVIFAEDDVPGIADATFTGFHSINQAEDGSVLFSGRMAGTGAPSYSDDGLWIEKDGTFTLVLREFSPAPGFTDTTINLAGGLNLSFFDVQGDRTIVFSGVLIGGGRVSRAYWIGTPFGANLALFLKVDSTPDLTNPVIFTATNQGNVAFTSVDSNSIQLDVVGDIYFDGGGKFANDTSISGIWKRSIIDGSISLLVPFDFANGLTDFELLDASNDGDVLFLAENTAGVEGLWLRDSAGALENVVSVGDMLEGREILDFADLSTVTGLFSQSSKTLGDHRFHDLFSSSGNFVFVAKFADDNGDLKLDEGIFIAQALPDPTTQFIWTGEAGDDDWHKSLNWDDDITGLDATHAPGGTSGTETVKILNDDVTISSSAVHILSIIAGGSLTVNQALTIEEPSVIEDLTLSSNLTIEGDLLLLGTQQLQNGVIGGTGAVDIEEVAIASWVPASQGGSDTKDLTTRMNISGTVNHGEGVTVNLKEDALIRIQAGGTYKAKTGKLAYSASNSLLHAIENAGTFEVSGVNGGDPFTIESFFGNDGGTIDVASGELILNTEGTHDGGEYKVASGATLVFGRSLAPTPLPTQVIGDVSGSGDGTIKLRNHEYSILAEKTASFNMSLATGGMEINEFSKVTGDGTLHNAGRMVFNDGTVTSAFVNDGTLVIGEKALGIREISDTQLVNNRAVLQQRGLVVHVIPDSDPRQGIVNNGTYEIGSDADADLIGLFGTQGNPPVFENTTQGMLKKTGAGEALLEDVVFENKGRVFVTQGTLFLDNSIWRDNPGIGGNTDIEITAGARLYLQDGARQFDLLSLTDSHHDFFNSTKIQGGGTLTIDGSVYISPPAFSTDLKLVNDASQLDLRPRRIYGKADTISTIENLGGTIHIHNPDGLSSDLVMNRVDLVNRVGSTVIHDDGVKLVLEHATQLINEGEYRFETGSSDIGAGLLPNERKTVTNNAGNMIFESGGSHTIEPNFEFLTDLSRGRVEVINGTSVTFEKPSTLTFSFEGLTRGNWLIGPDSKIEFGSSGAALINHIGANVTVRLGGSVDPLVPDGKFNNLPDVFGDFTNEGELTLANSTFRTTGNFNNNGNLFLNPGVLTAEGGNGFVNNGDLGGTGVINGQVVNGGEFVPGSSPGSITVNGDYTQTSAGSLQIELGGLEAAYDFDQFIVNGIAAFETGASVNITLIDPNPDDAVDEIFVPLTGDVFKFLVADELSLPGGTTLNDFISFANLPIGVVLDFRLAEVNGMTEVTLVADSTLIPPMGPRITIHPKMTTSTAGDSATFSVTADGATDLAYQWRLNGVDLPGAITSTYTLPSVQALHAGDYSVVVTGDVISVTSKAATLGVTAPAPNDARLLNLSTRAISLTGNNVLIPGFVIEGSGLKSLLIRAVGASLRADPFNIATALEDPQMTLKQWTGSAFEEVDTNNDWQTNSNAAEITQAIIDLGAFALTDSRDAALLVDLPAGRYTVVAGGVGDLTGVAIVELYDGDGDSTTTVLTNISNRGFVGTGASIMIPGVTVSSEGPKTFLVRAVGPALGQEPFNLNGVLEDPKMTIFAGQEQILSNDNWGDSPDAAYTAVIAAQLGAFALPEGSKDAAFVVTLPPGSFTIQAAGADGGEGTALVEVYVVE